MPYGIAAKPQEYDKLWSYISWLNRGNVVLNRNGEALHPKFASVEAVANYCRSGGVYVDYCGWAMYYDSIGGAPSKKRFGNFLRAAGVNPSRYWDGFAHIVIPYPGFPYRRAWVSPAYLQKATREDDPVMASYEAPSAVYPSPERPQRWFYTAVAVRVGRGWYFYGTGDVGGTANSRASVSPEAYARLIKLLVSSVEPPESCRPDDCRSEPLLCRACPSGVREHPCVGWVQRRLKQLGYAPGPTDCIFGTQTEKAVKRFQKDRGLVADGIVGPKTWAALKSQPPPDGGGGGGDGGGGGGNEIEQCIKAGCTWDYSKQLCVCGKERDWLPYLLIGGAAAAVVLGVYFIVKR